MQKENEKNKEIEAWKNYYKNQAEHFSSLALSDKNIKYIKEGLSPQEADKKIEFLKYRLEIFYRYSSEEGLKLPRLDEAILLNINSFPKTTNYDSPEITKEKQKSYVYNLFVSNNEIGFANKEEMKSYVNRLNR